MTDTDALRIHPWLPVLWLPDGLVRIHGCGTAGDVPRQAAPDVMAAARQVATTGRASVAASGMRILTAAGVVVPRTPLAQAAAAGRAIERAYLSRQARRGTDAHRVMRRSDWAVRLVGVGPLVQELATALRDCGMGVAQRKGPERRPVVVVHVGRPTATQIHEWMAAGLPHLSVSPRATSVRVGPLVQPGATACLQCLHLARLQRDQMWPWVSERLSQFPIPEPDPVLTLAATALAVRAVVALAETGTTAVADAYWAVDLDNPTPVRVPLARHPECGCWWPRLRDEMRQT